MPLHHSGLVSRYTLDHPNEKSQLAPVPLSYEHVLKYNPHHEKGTGRFAYGPGGTAGRQRQQIISALQSRQSARREGKTKTPRTQSLFDMGIMTPVTPRHPEAYYKFHEAKAFPGGRPHPGSMVGGVPTKRSTFS